MPAALPSCPAALQYNPTIQQIHRHRRFKHPQLQGYNEQRLLSHTKAAKASTLPYRTPTPSTIYKESTMPQPSFFARSSNSRDTNPLLPQTNQDISSYPLQDLSPSPSPSFSNPLSREPSRTASPSPPPSFYRSSNKDQHTLSLSPSSSRTRTRKIQFAAPPPPIATSVILHPVKQNNKSQRQPSLRWESAGSVASVSHRSSSPQVKKGSVLIDPLFGLERRERAIQRELQLLLDAQAAGLVEGFGGGKDEGSDAGSSTPTSRSLQKSWSRNDGSHNGSGGIVPVRQPKQKKIGLGRARRGLLRDMGELAGLKIEEVTILTTEIDRRGEMLEQVDTWEKKIEGAKEQLSGYSTSGEEGRGGGEEATEISELRNEERAVHNEIRELEDRLAEMKARKRWLGEQIRERDNRREARLSSYRGALREAESEVREFLKRPPMPASAVRGEEEGFMSLPSNRRTLGMAREWWTKELSQLQTRKEEVEREKSALEEGAQMWEDSVNIVTEFENDLRKQMANPEPQNAEQLRRQVNKMKYVTDNLENTAKVAEERGWNLLICAVGAELESFKEGDGILRGVLEVIEGSNKIPTDGDPNYKASNGLDELEETQDRRGSIDKEDSEDDGPNLAELLVDRSEHDNRS